jgi:sugar phosphate isomerase/epimerase
MLQKTISIRGQYVRILHLSDIHFRKSEVETSQDPNFHLRNELLKDAGFAEHCAWGTIGQNPSVIDAARFNGALEGEDHRRFKTYLANMLAAVPAYSDIALEQVWSTAGGCPPTNE